MNNFKGRATAHSKLLLPQNRVFLEFTVHFAFLLKAVEALKMKGGGLGRGIPLLGTGQPRL